MATPSTLSTLRRGTEARLITAMIVREDSMTLYGFADADARDLFQTLLGVSGVGPKIALATLAVLRRAGPAPGAGRRRRHRPDPVPGIGKRGAERMVLELRDKIGPVPPTGGVPAANGHAVRGPVVEALVGLGFAAKQAEEATDKVLADERGGHHQTRAAGGAVAAGEDRNEPVRRRRRRGRRPTARYRRR